MWALTLVAVAGCSPTNEPAAEPSSTPTPAPSPTLADDDDSAAGCADTDQDGFEDAGCGGEDCNDADPAVNPEAPEVCGDGIDQDCAPGAEACGLSGTLTATAAGAVTVVRTGDGPTGNWGNWRPRWVNWGLASIATVPDLLVLADGAGGDLEALQFQPKSVRTWALEWGGGYRWMGVVGADLAFATDPYGGSGDLSGSVEIFRTHSPDRTYGGSWEGTIVYPGLVDGYSNQECTDYPVDTALQLKTERCDGLLANGVPGLCVGTGGAELDDGGGGFRVFASAGLQGGLGPDDAVAHIEETWACAALGYRYATNLDFTGDAQDDVALNFDMAEHAGGEVRIYEGPLSGTTGGGEHRALLRGSVAGGRFGTMILEGLDLDEDGVGDLVVDEYEWWGPFEVGDPRARLFLGPFDGERGTDEADLLFESPLPDSPVLRDIDLLGDIDGDGHTDAAISWGAWNDDFGQLDTICIYYGPSDWSAGMPAADACISEDPDVRPASGARSRFGFDLAGGHDLNGDGLDDFVVSATDVEIGESVGALYIFHGESRED